MKIIKNPLFWVGTKNQVSSLSVTNALTNLKGAVTILMVAHRRSTVRMADIIYLLDSGEIIESGTWDQLQQGNNGRRFRHLWELESLSSTK